MEHKKANIIGITADISEEETSESEKSASSETNSQSPPNDIQIQDEGAIITVTFWTNFDVQMNIEDVLSFHNASISDYRG